MPPVLSSDDITIIAATMIVGRYRRGILTVPEIKACFVSRVGTSAFHSLPVIGCGFSTNVTNVPRNDSTTFLVSSLPWRWDRYFAKLPTGRQNGNTFWRDTPIKPFFVQYIFSLRDVKHFRSSNPVNLNTLK